MLQTGRQPDIIHCHDWSTATVARSYWEEYRSFGLHKSAVVFTIHNMNYGQVKIGEAALYSQRFTTVSPTYAFEVCRVAVVCRVVSFPSIACVHIGYCLHHQRVFPATSCVVYKHQQQIGSHPAIEPHAYKFMGIRNGIDMDIWDPETDQFLPRHFSVETMDEGKAAAREELRNRMGLTKWGDKPIVAVVSRLTRQKGAKGPDRWFTCGQHAAWWLP